MSPRQSLVAIPAAVYGADSLIGLIMLIGITNPSSLASRKNDKPRPRRRKRHTSIGSCGIWMCPIPDLPGEEVIHSVHMRVTSEKIGERSRPFSSL